MWAGRLMWLLPFLGILVGFAIPLKSSPNIYDLIEEQYGMKIAPDGTQSKVKPNDGGVQSDQAAAGENTKKEDV